MPLLKVEELYVEFNLYEGIAKVVDGVSITVVERERVGLVGESGCGKTVTMKSILRLLPMPPARIPKGDVLFRNKSILQMKAKEFRKLGGRGMSYVSQDPMGALNPVFKIGKQLMDVAKYNTAKHCSKKELKSLAIRVLKSTKLPDPERIMGNYSFQLSGGMQQRILIAMALVTNPNLLVLDEPGTALDVTIQAQILSLLLELSREKQVSILIVTHDLGVIREVTERSYVMYAGHIMEVGRTAAILSKPQHPYTQGLLDSVPKLTGEGIAGGIRGSIPDYLNPPRGCRFQPRCDHRMPICEENRPPLIEIEESRFAACFLHRGG